MLTHTLTHTGKRAGGNNGDKSDGEHVLVGSDHRRVLVLSTIVGSIFLIWCDVAARMVLGNEELPIGIVTAMIGGPFFVWLMLTKSYGFGDE